jgi:hypothetical protein
MNTINVFTILLQNAFIAADDIEIGLQEKIPLCFFGFCIEKVLISLIVNLKKSFLWNIIQINMYIFGI